MKNGDIICAFKAVHESSMGNYSSYTSTYICFYRNKRPVIFQPFEMGKPKQTGFWYDHKRYLVLPEDIAKYFHVNESKTLSLIELMSKFNDSTRGLDKIKAIDIITYINLVLEKLNLTLLSSMDDLENCTCDYWTKK